MLNYQSMHNAVMSMFKLRPLNGNHENTQAPISQGQPLVSDDAVMIV